MKYKKIQHSMMLFIITFFSYTSSFAGAEQVYDATLGYALDLPEGFTLVSSVGSNHFAFQHSLFPVDVQLAVYPEQRFNRIEETAEYIFNQLVAEKKALPFSYLGNAALIAFLQFKRENEHFAGWLLLLALPQQKGWFMLLTYARDPIMKRYERFMLSILDAVFITSQSYTEPGPITQAVYPKTEQLRIETQFNDETIFFDFDSFDSEANQSVIDREFSILSLYIDTPFLQSAWQRYYRIIYRDSWSRCYSVSRAIERELTIAAKGRKLPSEYIAENILKWLQKFVYTRNRNGADFMNLPTVCMSQTGDCDSRALLMALVLQQLHIDSILLISPKYQHALAAVDCAGNGARFLHNGKNYLIAETTAQVPLGRIAQEHSDSSAWFAVDWYKTDTAFP